MNLQEFVSNTVETLGGIVLPLEYALCQVLLPDKYAARFQGRTELTLAFDFEVAEENPDAEFVTFGSNILSEVIDIVKTSPESTIRYVSAERLELSSPEEKIKRMIDDKCSLELTSKAPVMGLWGLFVFHLHFMSDESFENIQEVWVNLLTGEVDDAIVTTNVFYETNRLYPYPYAATAGLDKAFEIAWRYVNNDAEKQAAKYTSPSKIKEELNRIENYYHELLLENQRRATRKGLSQERVEELESKSAALELEKTRQMQEMKDNLTPKARITLLQGITYHIPLMELKCLVSKRLEKAERVFYYEPLYKRLFEVPAAGR